MKIQNRENLIFSYLALAFLVILVLTLVILAYLDNKNPDIVIDDNLEPMPKANVLTEEEMQTELNLLSERADSPSKIVEYVEQGSDENSSDSESSDTTSISSGNSAGGKNFNTENAGVESKSYTPTYSVVESNNATVMSVSGTIYSVQGDIVVISDGSGFAKAKIDSQTNISINGKKISIDSLQPAQKVHVEGFGDLSTRELKAETLMVMGEVQVIPF